MTTVDESATPRLQNSSTGARVHPLILWFWALGPAAILVAAAVLQTGNGRAVSLPGLEITVPETCTLYARFGIDCPGCGLTRAFIHLAHAQPLAAWRLNSLSWFLFAYVAVQIPLAILHLRQTRASWFLFATRLNEWGLVVIMGALSVRWIIILVAGEIFQT